MSRFDGIATRSWPRAERSAYQRLIREQADQQQLKTICGHCGAERVGLAGDNRAWWQAHRCGP